MEVSWLKDEKGTAFPKSCAGSIVWEERTKAEADGDTETVELIDALYGPGSREALVALLERKDWEEPVCQAFREEEAPDPDDVEDVPT